MFYNSKHVQTLELTESPISPVLLPLIRHSERLYSENALAISACNSPWSNKNIYIEIPAGGTIADILEVTQPNKILRKHCHVFLGDQYVNPEYYSVVKPKPGVSIFIRMVPSGGGGGDKDPLRTVLTIAVIAASFAFGPALGGALGITEGAGASLGLAAGAVQSAVGGAIISIAGNLLMNAIAPPPKPRLGQISGGLTSRDSPTLFVTGTRNQFNPFGVVPRLLGTHLITPPYAAKPFTETAGDDQYVRLLFSLGYGPVVISDERIGETALDAFEGVETEFKRGYQPSQLTDQGNWAPSGSVFPSSPTFGDRYTATDEGTVDTIAYITGDTIIFNDLFTDTTNEAWDLNHDKPHLLYTDDVFEDSLAITLTQIDGYSQRTSQIDADELSVDITFNNGLVQFSDRAVKQNRTVVVEVEWSPTGAETWTTIHTFTVTARQTSAVRKTFKWATGLRAQYDVRLRRTTADNTSSSTQDVVFWSVLRTFTNVDPIQLVGMASMAMRIKATDQLRGIVDQYNLISSAIILDWDSGSSTWKYRVTSNPASAYRETLQGPANARPLIDARLDLPSIQDWHDFNVANGFEFNMVRDFLSTVLETITDITSVGRASRIIVDGKWGVIIDQEQFTYTQHFSPRNSWAFTGEKLFPELPHAWRIRFINRDKRWKHDERIVYDDGFDANNATEFETLDLPAITDPEHIWKDGRYHIATVRLRPEIFTLSTDFEYIIATRGSRCTITHDVMLVGLASPRISEVIMDGSGDAIQIVVDDEIEMQSGKTYGVSIRTDVNDALTQSVTLSVGKGNLLTFVSPIPAANIPTKGDLCAFGELGSETLDVIVSKINPTSDLAAKISFVEAAPAIHIADQDIIPDFSSNITLPVEIPFPAITDIKSDESVLVRHDDGSWEIQIRVFFAFADRRLDVVKTIEARFRPSGSAGPYLFAMAPGMASEINLAPVESAEDYELQVRFITNDGGGPWGPLVTHTVEGIIALPIGPSIVFREGNFIKWLYPVPPRDFEGFRVKTRAGTIVNWDDGNIIISEDLVQVQEFNVNLLHTGIHTVMIKAVDVAGNESAEPTILIVSIGSTATVNILKVIDHTALGYPGTITDGSISGTDVIADDQGFLYLPVSDDPYLPIGSDLYLPVTFKNMQYEAIIIPDLIDTPSILTINNTFSGVSWTIEYRTQGDSLYLPEGSNNYLETGQDPYLENVDWRTFPSFLDNITRQKYDIRITFAGGSVQGVIDDLTFVLSVDDITEIVSNVAISSGGTRLPITKTYRVIKTIEDITLDDVGTAVTLRVADKDATLGPLMKALDDAGASTTATLNSATIRGY